ncbi:MAG: hypothetical protein ABIS01_13900, partial [Ferruginibacter sp.]
MKIFFPLLLLHITWLPACAQNVAKRTLKPTDVYLLKTIGEAKISPEGKWILYTVSNVDTAKDKRNTDIWMISLDGAQTVQLTNSDEAEHMPRWSPDG